MPFCAGDLVFTVDLLGIPRGGDQCEEFCEMMRALDRVWLEVYAAQLKKK